MSGEPPSAADRAGLLALRRGRSPNCSSAGSVVGAALVSAAAAAVVLNAWADRYLRWRGAPAKEGGAGGSAGGPGPDAPDREVDHDGASTGPTPTRPRLRAEPFGGILAWPEPGALLYLDPGATAAAAGALQVGAAAPDAPPGALSAPTEAHLALTGRCPARCEGCYLDAGPDAPGPEPGLPALRRDLRALAEMGVFEVAFGGGEALLRDGVLSLADEARALGLVPNLTTSGFGLTPSLAAEMAARFGQVNVSLDGLSAVYAAARGWDGAALGLRAIALLRGAGARVGVNTVLSRPLLDTPGALEALGDQIAALGVVEWQWLRLKPAGRGRAAYGALAPTPEQRAAIWTRALEAEARTGLQIRFDCALTPFLAAAGLDPSRMERLGVTGCPGGESLWARGADGAWTPCSFVDSAGEPAGAGARPASDGDAALPARWRKDPTLGRWRARALAPPAPCADCAHRAVCRGGCRVHAGALTGDPLAPDPECPRVIAARVEAEA